MTEKGRPSGDADGLFCCLGSGRRVRWTRQRKKEATFDPRSASGAGKLRTIESWRRTSWWRWGGTGRARIGSRPAPRSEEHTSELQSLMRISYDVFCLKKKNIKRRDDSD